MSKKRRSDFITRRFVKSLEKEKKEKEARNDHGKKKTQRVRDIMRRLKSMREISVRKSMNHERNTPSTIVGNLRQRIKSP